MITRSLLIAGGAVLLAGTSAAQSRYLYSINWHGPTVGAPSAPGGIPITEGDILTPSTGTSLPALGPLGPPSIALAHTTALGLPGACIGHLGGTPCIVEVDAFSRGIDRLLQPNQPLNPGDILFSVDEFARGFPFGSPGPNVITESVAMEAASDAFANLFPLPPAPVPPAPMPNIGVVDGNGLVSASGFAYPGVGVIEPNAPFGGLPDTGDNKDALDFVEPFAGGPPGGIYYSLDSGFFDPLEGIPNSGSALANGFFGGDVLTIGAAGLPIVFAPAPVLGLDLIAGVDSDDLDALILVENGNGVYNPSLMPYDWVTGGTDMLIFSVRRGSAIIGMPDSFFGLPIEAGDLLVPPIAGGVSPFPGIFIAAESLGLATLRLGVGNIGDDLNAADTLFGNVFDCDGDGVEDAVAIAMGMVPDVNMNGIPDGCETGAVGTSFCFCPTVSSPCGNASPTTGCINVAGTGALLTASGTASVMLDNLVLTTSGMTPASFALTFMGSATIPPVILANGLRCVGGSIYRFPPFATGGGTASLGPGIVGFTLGANPPAGWITALSTWHFQTFYRDVGGPCGASFNVSSALSVTFTP